MAGTFCNSGPRSFLPHDLHMREYVRLVNRHSNFDSSCFPLQMKDLHSERCQYTSNILRDLIVQGDQEALQVVAAAAEEGIAGMYLYFPFSFWLPEHLLTEAFSGTQVRSLHSPHCFTGFDLICFCFPGHDLEKLADFDLQKVPNVQTLGSNMVRRIQHIMESQFSHSECGPALPEDQIQSIIVRVSNYTFIIYYDIALIHFDTHYHNMVYVF